MPGMDDTGPMGCGPMTGGRRGSCAGEAAEVGRGGGAGRGAGMGRSRGGGHGWRNQFRATGLTGWQRAAQADTPATAGGASPDPVARLESRLVEVVERLDRLEAGQK